MQVKRGRHLQNGRWQNNPAGRRKKTKKKKNAGERQNGIAGSGRNPRNGNAQTQQDPERQKRWQNEQV